MGHHVVILSRAMSAFCLAALTGKSTRAIHTHVCQNKMLAASDYYLYDQLKTHNFIEYCKTIYFN